MKKQVKRKKKITIETAMVLMLNAFTIGMFVQKIIMCGTSWLSTVGYLGQKGDENMKIVKLNTVYR